MKPTRYPLMLLSIPGIYLLGCGTDPAGLGIPATGLIPGTYSGTTNSVGAMTVVAAGSTTPTVVDLAFNTLLVETIGESGLPQTIDGDPIVGAVYGMSSGLADIFLTLAKIDQNADGVVLVYDVAIDFYDGSGNYLGTVFGTGRDAYLATGDNEISYSRKIVASGGVGADAVVWDQEITGTLTR